MLLNRKSTGLEISPSGLLFTLLSGRSAEPKLERLATRHLPAGVLRPSLRELNILEKPVFVEKLREAHALLLDRNTRISVSLPDAVGKVLILEMDERFKSRAEALDIIRWKLKKSLPFELTDCHLDYQFLKRNESTQSLLVTLVSRSVIEQYEEAITAAGLLPVRIDLNSFSLYRSFEQSAAKLEEGVLITFYGGTLGMLFFSDGVPEFVRYKELSGILDNASRIYSEINSSLLVYREKYADRPLKSIQCIVPPGLARDFGDMLEELGGSRPVLLEVKSAIKQSNDSPGDQETLYPFTAAVGAALRSL
jgi:type IV pilus assembly protein PilM